MIAIIDYGVGNLFSLCSSFKAIGEDAIITNDKKVIDSAKKIILPGVGAFSDAVKKLNESGMAEVLKEQSSKGKDIMGICLGMQLLFEKSFEYGEHKGLNLLKGEVVSMRDVVDKELDVPQIGWNALHFEKKSNIFKYINEGDCVYFVHSYYVTNSPNVIATTEYSVPITAAVQKDNIYGCQFHPEKSGKVGLNILKAFSENK